MKTTKISPDSKTKPKILVIRPERQTCEAFYKKFRCFEVSYLNIGEVGNLSFYLIKGLREKIHDTDLVCISDNYYSYNLQAVFWAKFYNKPIVTILWATIPNHISSWLFPYSFISKYVIKNTSLFVLRNKTAISFAVSIGAPINKIKVIYKGVDLKHFYPVKKIQKSTVDILYVGNFHRSKGLEDLIVVFEKFVKEGLPVKLILAGRGEMTNFVNKKAETLPIKNYGFVSYDKLGDLYRRGDIFCSPSKEIRFLGIKIWEEYFSYTLMEAQASGLPIVATNMGGIPEEVGGHNLLVEPGNVDALYESLKKMVMDSKLRGKLSRLNRNRAVELFNAQRQAEMTEKAILTIC